jgi:hypothetical protein
MSQVYNSLIRAARSPRLGLAAALLVASTSIAHAQFAYKPALTQNIAGTYTDLGTTGTVIATANTDDANSAAQNIGFTFNYNGTAFTQFVLNTNGLLRLGANAPSTATARSPYAQAPELGPINSTNAADVNLLLPFNFDLTAGTSTPEYRVSTTGTAGSRICTIQWKNVADKAVATDASTATVLPTQYSNFSFQVKLYEGSNQIDFVYGTATPGTSALKYAVVGLKGSLNTIGNDVLGMKASADTWTTAAFVTGRQYGADLVNAFNFRSTVAPDAGRTLRFTACTPASVVTTFPYVETFDSVAAGDLPCGITGDDANNDGYSWFTDDSFFSASSPNALLYYYNDNDNSIGGNDWVFTRGLSLRAGYTYQLQFKYAASDPLYAEGLEVKYGTVATPAGQTNLLFSNTAINNGTFATTTASQVSLITPTANGTYYIGFHAISQPDRYVLLLDDVQVVETQILAVRNATNTVFTAQATPVPFGESLTLTLNTLKAGPLHLTMRDALGRVLRQSTTTALVGTSTIAVPEVANLPAGVYFLNVEQGGATQVLRVAHQ